MLLDPGFVTQITDVAQQLQAALEAGGETQMGDVSEVQEDSDGHHVSTSLMSAAAL